MLALQERARLLHEAINPTQPLLAGGTPMETNFQWVCASLVPLGGFRGMGRTQRPVFTCQLNMRQHVQQLLQHCLELWTHRWTTRG